jgi:hypothetical protein
MLQGIGRHRHDDRRQGLWLGEHRRWREDR